MSRSNPILVAAIAVLCAGPALSADDTGEFAIKGAGAQTCAGLLRAYETKSSDLGLYGGWIEGYLTAENRHTDKTYDLAPWQTTESLLALTGSACGKLPPDTRFIDAFYQIERLLVPSRLETKSAAEGIRSGTETLILYTDTIRSMKMRLSEAGFDPGPVDDPFDERTTKALAAFQKSRGLPETGLPDQRSLFDLLMKGEAPE